MPFTIGEINEKLASLPGWEMLGTEISKEFTFKDFKEAIEFINTLAEESERLKHHPDIVIRYNKVTINLTTHSENGLTSKDFELAKIIEQLI